MAPYRDLSLHWFFKISHFINYELYKTCFYLSVMTSNVVWISAIILYFFLSTLVFVRLNDNMDLSKTGIFSFVSNVMILKKKT